MKARPFDALRKSRRKSKKKGQRARSQYRPRVETLEDRRMLAVSPPLLTTVEGFNVDDNAYNTAAAVIEPPDPTGAVGPAHIMNTGNTTLQWFTKDGTQQMHTSLRNFFAPIRPIPNATLFDPKVLYDQYEDRFIVVALEQMDLTTGTANTSRILLGVSDDSDPNGNWNFTSINSTFIEEDPANPGTYLTYWTDYPGFAFDSEAIYVTGSLFEFTSGVANGNRLWIIDKGATTDGFYANGTASFNVYDAAGDAGVDFTVRPDYDPANPQPFRSMQPTVMFGDTPGGVGTWLAMYDGHSDTLNEYVDLVRVDDPLGTPTFTLTTVDVGDIDDTVAYVLVPPMIQRGATSVLDGSDRRTMNAVWRNDSLYVTTNVIPTTGPDIAQNTAHWFRFDTAGSSIPALADQGDIGGETIGFATDTSWASVMVDADDNMAVAFAASGPAIYPGAYYAMRAVDDAPGTMRDAVALAEGLDVYGLTRWGDYSSVALDPTDQVTLWAYHEYSLPEQGQGGRWGTRWGSFRLGDAPVGPTPGSTTVMGLKWQDLDEDGRKDDDEPVIEGWLIYADLDGDGQLDIGEPTGRTNPAGYFTMTFDSPAGDLTIRETMRPGWKQTYPLDRTGEEFHTITIGATGGETFTTDFGNSDNDGFDHGDAPTPYPTLESANGPTHAILSGVQLGALIDGEPDGLPEANAQGDDLNNLADEDGVSFLGALAPGGTGQVDITVSTGSAGTAMLQGWVDFNRDGDWADAGEQIFTNVSLAAGTHRLSFAVPSSALPGQTYSRFRLAQERDLSFVGAAQSGEVEDHQIDILSNEPIAVDDNYSVEQDSTNNPLFVMNNDIPSASGRENLQLFSVNDAGASGTAVIDDNGTPGDLTDDFIRYTPAPGAFAPDAFTYTIKDVVSQATDTATVSVEITPAVGTAPVAVDDTYTFPTGTSFPQALFILSNDRPGPTGSISIPANGLDTTGTLGTATLVNQGGTQLVNYTPPVGFSGTDQFAYTIQDSAGVESTGTVTIQVREFANDDIVGLDIRFTDENDVPLPLRNGVPIIGQGMQFKAQLWVDDLRVPIGTGNPPPELPPGLTLADQGVYSAYMDMLYQAGFVSYAGNVQYDPAYPAGHNSLNASVPGVLDEIGAFQGGSGTPLGTDPHLLFSALFTANAQGRVNFATDPADILPLHETAVNFPPEPAIDYPQITYGSAVLDIIEPEKLVNVELVATADAAGQIPLPNNQVTLGTEFYVHALVQDIRDTQSTPPVSPGDEGAFSAYLDVLYNNSLTQPNMTPGSGLGFQIAFGPLFPNGQNGNANSPGLLDEVGAVQSTFPTTSNGQLVLFTVPFRAVGTGSVIFEADPADDLPFHEITVINPEYSVPPAQVNYIDTPAITIVAGAGEGEFTNPVNPLDVNDDTFVSPIDALLLVNYLNANGATDLSGLAAGGEGESGRYYYDVNADLSISPIDVLSVINFINNKQGSGSGEGEATDAPAQLQAIPTPTQAIVDSLAADGGEVAPSEAPGGAQLNDAVWTTAEQNDPVLASAGSDVESLLTDDLAEDILGAWDAPGLEAVA